MALGRFLRLFETTVVLRGDSLSGFTQEGAFHDNFNVNTGSRLVFSLFVDDIDVGANINVNIKNRFSEDIPFQPILQWGASVAGYTTRVVTDFHNLFDAEIVVTGGYAKAWLGVTVFDNALATRIENAVIEAALSHIAGIDGRYDSIRIGDGVDLLGINQDGSINVNIVQGVNGPPEKVKEFFNEITSIASGTESDVVSYTVPAGKSANLQKIEFSGSNTAEYRYYKNGTITGMKRTHHGSGLTGEFDFFSGSEEGIPLIAGDVVKLTAKHAFRETGAFEARVQVLEIG